MVPLLEARRISSGYGEVAVIHEVTLEVNPGEVVALLGPNGAGKTTTVLTMSGVLARSAGDLLVNGCLTHAPLHRRAREGLALVTEERCLFRQLSVADNLRVCGGDPKIAMSLFPALEPRLKVKAGLLSGGEQQMLALGRVLSRRPSLLIADELSLGLAAPVASGLLKTVRAAASEGIGVLIVEQHVDRILEVADRAYLINRGEIVYSGSASDMKKHLEVVQD